MSNIIDLGPVTAYALARKHGFQGTEAEWLASLKGDPATDATVPDGSITEAKLAQDVKDKLSKLSEEIANLGGTGTGAPGQDGVGIRSVEQTTTSTEDGGTNVVTVTKTDGTSSTFQVRNGSKGSPGAGGKSAYQYAREGGYTGTEAEFAAKLAEEIPDKLPNPNALTFTGAVTGSYDGSAPLEVAIPSGGGGGGSGEKWVKIADYTWTDEDAAETNPPYLTYSTDADGNALAIDALYISCDAKTSTTRTLYGKLSVVGNMNYTIKAENMFVNGQKLIVYNELKKLPSPHAIGYAANGPVGANGGVAGKYYIKQFNNESLFEYPATGISIFPNAQILAGSTFSIWGRVANV